MRFTRSMIEKKSQYFTYNGYTKYWRHICQWDSENKLVVDFVRNGNVRTYRANCRIVGNRQVLWNFNGTGKKLPQAESTCYIPQSGIPEDTKHARDNKQQDNSRLVDWRPYMKRMYEFMIMEGE